MESNLNPDTRISCQSCGGACLLVRATTGHGKHKCGAITHFLQASVPRSVFDDGHVAVISHGTDRDGNLGVLKNGLNKMDRCGVMGTPLPRGDPLGRDTSGQRWGDDWRDHAIFINAKKLDKFIERPGMAFTHRGRGFSPCAQR